METEFIEFERRGIPLKISTLKMTKEGIFRGLHSHGAYEIVEVKSGCLLCCVNGDQIRLKPNEILIINNNISHKLCYEVAEADVVYTQIDFHTLWENDSSDDFSLLSRFIFYADAKPYMVFSNHQQLQSILNKIYVRYEEGESGKLYLKAYIYELLAFMDEWAFLPKQTVEAAKLQKIQGIVWYINENFRSPITLDDICQTVKYNRYTVCRLFHGATGKTVFAYINFLRTHYAVEMLKENKYTILEIATESGFSTVTYFNRVFKSIMGCAPSVYRKYV
jgi:AraC-like DNA-binding protein